MRNNIGVLERKQLPDAEPTYFAQIEGESVGQYGGSIYEAVGALIVANQNKFGVSIELIKREPIK